jgi:predicted dienelactone hydrolase
VLHRTRTWAHFALILVALSSLSVVFAQDAKPEPVGLRPDAPTYALHGPYWVGTIQFETKTPSHPTKIQFWYPALNAKAAIESVQYPHDYWPDYGVLPVIGNALQDADPNRVDGSYPLVIFSHGMNAGKYQSVYLYEHLASYGFVVMSMDYIDNFATQGKVPFEAIFFTRPQDVSWQIDYAAELNGKGQKFSDLIDLNHIAVIGVSQGGTAALNVSGAPLDISQFKIACKKEPSIGQMPASLGGGNICTDQAAIITGLETGLTKLAGLQTLPVEMWPSWAEPRLDAAIYLAPTSILFGEKSFQKVMMPTLLIGGSADHGVVGPPEANFTRAYEGLGSSQKSLIMLKNASHAVYGVSCSAAPWLVQGGLFSECSDPVWNMDRAHDLINHFTTAFLLDILKGDKEAAKALAPDAVKFPGIEYKAQGF